MIFCHTSVTFETLVPQTFVEFTGPTNGRRYENQVSTFSRTLGPIATRTTTTTTTMTTKTIAGYPKLLPCQIASVLIFSLMIISTVVAWQPSSGSRGMTIRKIPRHAHLDEGVSRRKAMNSIALLPFIVGRLSPGHAAEEQSIVTTEPIIQYENRNRNNNKDAIIREDYWFMMGKTPPRRLPKGALAQTDDPQWNAFGSCQTQNGNGVASNSCTYVSWKQRIPAYSKYGSASL